MPQAGSHSVCNGNSFLAIKRSEREADPYPLSRSDVKNIPYSSTSAWRGASLCRRQLCPVIWMPSVSWLSHSDYKLLSQCSTIYFLHPRLQQPHTLSLLAECGRNIHNWYLIAWHSNHWQACVPFVSVMWMGDKIRRDWWREWREEEESWKNREREGGQGWKKDVKDE